MTYDPHAPLDPSHRMVLAIECSARGDILHVEAIAVPTWLDCAHDGPLFDPLAPPLEEGEERAAVQPGPLPFDEDVTLLFVPGGRVVLRFDGARSTRP
jgi:hypothetical protein